MRTYLNKLIQDVINWLYQSRRRFAIGGVGLLACFIGYHAVFGANGFLVYRDKKTELRTLSQEIQALQQDNANRQERIKALTSDPQTIEREARERLRYARKGEIIYTLPQAKPNTPAKKH
jgi:cell division protein FtsB